MFNCFSKIKGEFFEAEAELSGDEGSEDELEGSDFDDDVEGLIGSVNISDAKLRKEIGRAHL